MIGTTQRVITRTKRGIRLSVTHPTGRKVTVLSIGVYLILYLISIGKLRFGRTGFDVVVATNPLSQFTRQTFGTFTYEPVILIRLWMFTYQFSMNTLIGISIGILVGINVGLSYVLWRQPARCGIGSQSAGIMASVPALLSGTACCAPVLILLLGLQITGTMLLMFELLLPIAILLLLGSLILVSYRLTPAK